MIVNADLFTGQDHVDAFKNNPTRLASCGHCYFETEVQVVNDNGEPVAPGVVGEIVVKGPGVMMGYFNGPEITKETMRDGAYLTPDLAIVDDEGYISIVDRKKEMIISGGFNIYLSGIERVLYKHNAVYEAAVVGAPDGVVNMVIGDGRNVGNHLVPTPMCKWPPSQGRPKPAY